MRILEISSAEAGAAFAGKLFARWGHEVIRAELPDREPPWESEVIYLHGGKQRIAADYRTDDGRAYLDRLAAGCDIVVTDVLAADVREHRLLELGMTEEGGPAARIAITPFGLTGPYADLPATEATLLALAGHTFLMGDPDREPLSMPGHYGSYQAGSLAYVAGLASALAPQTPGSREVDISILEVLVGLHQYTDVRYYYGDRIRSRHGNRVEHAAGTMLPVKDGWIGFSLLQNFWEPFAMMIGRPDLIEGDRMSTNEGRLANRDEFEAMVIEALGNKPKYELFREAQETWRVALGYTATLQDCLDDPHLQERDFWRPLPGYMAKDGTPFVVPGSPFRFVGVDRPAERPPAAVEPASESLLATGGAPRRPRRSPDGSAARPLEGVRILDMTQVWAGPLSARLLGDLGAEVILVEPATARGPSKVPPGSVAYVNGGQMPDPWNYAALFNKLHRNRKSLCLDLKAEGARELFLDLVRESDVVMENFSARAMTRLGLSYDTLREVNPRIIYASLPAFGQHGPYGQYVGYGPGIEPMIGLAAIMGYEGDEPRISGTTITDAMGGVAGAAGILTALERREVTGEGAWVDLSQHEAGMALFGEYFVERQLTGEEPQRLINAHRAHAPHGIYPCEGTDNWISLAARTDAEWAALCRAAGRRWESDARFATAEARREHRAALDAAIADWTRGHGHIALADELRWGGVPAGAVLRVNEYLEEPGLLARGYYAALLHHQTGRQQFDGGSWVFDGDRGYDRWLAGPTLGEHNSAVLSGILGLSEAQIADLAARGVIRDRPPV